MNLLRKENRIVFVVTLVLTVTFLGITYFLSNFIKDMPQYLITIIATGVMSIIAASLMPLILKYYEHKFILDIERSKDTKQLYEEFVNFHFDLHLVKPKKTVEDVIDYYNEFSRKILLTGTDQVIHAWIEYRDFFNYRDWKDFNFETSDEFEFLLLVIRRDYSCIDTKLKGKGNPLLKLFPERNFNKE